MNMSIKTKKINLDLPPSKRWNDLLQEYKYELLIAKKEMINMIEQLLGHSYYIVMPLIKTFRLSGSIKYIEELESISKIMDMSFEYVLLLQLCYEACSCCTSVITKVNNRDTFFRTMDWPLKFLNKLTVQLEFVKDGRLLYSATSWAGYIGILTAVVPEKYGLAVNYRRTQNITSTAMLQNTWKMMNMYWPIGYLIRDICENEHSYDQMISILKKAKIVSPCYITICGCNQLPKIITRDSTEYTIYQNKFVVQTNCDQDKTEPDILYSVERRRKITKIINENNNDFDSVDEMIKKFYIEPIKNDETIYCSVMIPSTGLLISF
jgi:hypothetical protein